MDHHFVGIPTLADATARFPRARDAGPVTFVITGEDGQAEEDLACADYIAQRMNSHDDAAAPTPVAREPPMPRPISPMD